MLNDRKKAKQAGHDFYVSNKPCCRGHITKRRVDSGSCVECLSITKKQRNENRKAKLNNQYYIHLCNKCNAETNHYTSNGNCSTCHKKIASDHYLSNKSKYLLKFKKYNLDNIEQIRQKKAKHYNDNKARILLDQKEYRILNKDKIKEYRKKPHAMEAHRNRQFKISQTTDGKLSNSFRLMITRIMKKNGCSSFDLLPFTKDQFIDRFELLFKDGMSWDNYGEWHIDHIIPISAFLKEGFNDQKIINSLFNLQPLWANENIAKKDKYNGIISQDIVILESKNDET